jgi:hypothetical protein
MAMTGGPHLSAGGREKREVGRLSWAAGKWWAEEESGLREKTKRRRRR